MYISILYISVVYPGFLKRASKSPNSMVTIITERIGEMVTLITEGIGEMVTLITEGIGEIVPKEYLRFLERYAPYNPLFRHCTYYLI